MMPANVETVLAELAKVEGDDDSAQVRVLGEALVELTQGAVPAGALRRLWIFGGLQAQVCLAYAVYWAKSWMRDAERRERDLAEAHLRAAIKMVRAMGYLRGAAQKLGQTLANFPDVLPDQIVETLERLHFDSPPMHFSLLREQVRNELGHDPEELFTSFEPRAFAAASLGQVHRATLKTGEGVAVKIQYPAIGRSVRSDFRNLSALMLPMRLGREWEFVKAQIDDIRRVLEEETDYEREADSQRRARSLFRDDEEIVVANVYDDLSTRRVLTMDYLEGVHVQEFLARNPPQSERDHFATLIFRAGSRLHYKGKLLYSDAHPGNYLFGSDGRLGFIDFGCVRPYTDAEWECCRLADRAIFGGKDDMERVVRSSLALGEGEDVDRDHHALVEAWARWMWRPYWHEGLFDFGDSRYLREGVDIFADLVGRRYTRGLPMSVFLTRWFFGTCGLFYRLRARVDVRSIDVTERAAAGWGPE
jgi:predicted unusual protein kinase regulating ubiquinone biosynthesis (AarF/ABC1/UbiB family)